MLQFFKALGVVTPVYIPPKPLPLSSRKRVNQLVA